MSAPKKLRYVGDLDEVECAGLPGVIKRRAIVEVDDPDFAASLIASGNFEAYKAPANKPALKPEPPTAPVVAPTPPTED